MALKSFARLSTRNRGSIVSQIHKLMKLYGDFFSIRERSYLRKLTEIDGAIYWIPEGLNVLIALAMIEPDHTFQLHGHTLHSMGYLISKKPGFMNRILQHIISDYENMSLLLFSKPSLAARIPCSDFGLVECTAEFLQEHCPELANHPTTYFNMSETLAEGLNRRGYSIYIKASAECMDSLREANLAVFNHLSI